MAVLGAFLVPLPTGAAARSPEQLVRPGIGEFRLDGPAGLHVYYSAPPEPSTARILIGVHGLSRDARGHRDDWARLVGGRNVLVLVPELTAAAYPEYNLGDAVDARGAVRPARRWSFGVVEELFDRVTADVGSDARTYALFGFSGGAQFAHRLVELVPGHRADVVVAANAGWYTMPDGAEPYPWGLAGTPAGPDDLARVFATRLVLVLGRRDADPRDPSLRRDPRTDRQGTQRLDRGRAFHRRAAAAARALALPFAWRLHEEPELAHDHAGAARAALPYLLDGR